MINARVFGYTMKLLRVSKKKKKTATKISEIPGGGPDAFIMKFFLSHFFCFYSFLVIVSASRIYSLMKHCFTPAAIYARGD